MTKQVKLVLLTVLVFLIVLAVPSYSWTRKNIDETKNKFFENLKKKKMICSPESSRKSTKSIKSEICSSSCGPVG